MKLSILSILFLLLIPAFSVAQDAEYNQLLRNYFKASGTDASFEVAIKQTMNTMKEVYSDIPQDIWDKVEDEFLKTSLDDLVSMLAPVYNKYLTKSDLVVVINFYESSVGKKLANNTPAIMQESMQVGQQWGTQIGEKLLKRLDEEGY